MAHLEDRPGLLVALLEGGLALVGIRVHRAELEAGERHAADAGPHRAIDHATARAQLHGDRRRQQDRREEQDEQRGDDDVEPALQHEVDSLEHGGLELEQRHRLARDELDPVHEDLHRRRRDAHADARAVAAVHQVDRLLLREIRVRDQDLVDLVEAVLERVERPEVAEAVLRTRGERDEPDGVERRVGAATEGVGDGVDLVALADDHRAPPVAGGPQRPAADTVEHPAERRHVDEREEEAAIEDVVRGEVLTLDQGVREHDEGDLHERGHDAREAGADRAVRVEAGAGEQQQGHEDREGRPVLRLLEGGGEVGLAVDQGLQLERGPDRAIDSGDVQRAQDHDPREAAHRLIPDEGAPDGRLTGAYVAGWERHRGPRLQLLQLFDQSVRHLGVACRPLQQRRGGNVAVGREISPFRGPHRDSARA